MKKIISYLGLLCIMSVLVSGCGGEFAEDPQWQAATGSAVSGEAVSGDSVSGEAVRPDGTEKSGKEKDSTDMPLEDHQFCSANCLYMADSDKNELIQYCIKTGKEKSYEVKGLLGVLLVEKDKIYYTKSFWDGENEDGEPEDQYRICSMPIVSGEDGLEKPLVQKEERLEDIPPLSYENYPLMDEESIYYIPYGSQGMIQYDRKEKKGEAVPLEYCTGVEKRKEKTIFYSDTDDEDIIGVLDKKTDQMITIQLPEEIWDWDSADSVIVPADDGLYYSWYLKGDPGWPEVKRVDFSTQDTTTFVTEREIKSVLEEKAGIKENSVRECAMDLEVVGERLYLTLYLEWTKGACWNVQDVILSRELGTEGKLQYEEGLTECIRKYGKTRRGEPKKFNDYTFGAKAKEEGGIEEICYNAGFYAAIGEERAYLNPGTMEFLDGEKYILFDRKTGKGKPVKKGMPEYYELYYDRVWEEDYDD